METHTLQLPTSATPINADVVSKTIKHAGLSNIGEATIREIVKIVNQIESQTHQKYIRMEMGVPGLEPPQVAIDGEKKALDKGVASKYPSIDGIPELKHELSRFLKLFANIDIRPEGCIPTVGSMQGGYAAFMVAGNARENKNTTLFIDPGFPVQKQQQKLLGLPYKSFDVYNYRGDKLRGKLLEYMEQGNIATIIYSNPNNPSWIAFTEKELKTIAEMANTYNAIVIEDLAYFGMDFRADISIPGKPPYQPSIAHYTDNYILLISGSKSFSYAGQRIAGMAISDKLYKKRFPALQSSFNSEAFGHAMVYGALYGLSAGVAHSVQYGFKEVLKATNDGNYNFVEGVKPYKRNAQIMKKLFIDNGFDIVYAYDEDAPIADGFYFTISYPGMEGDELLERLLYYGISAITLKTTGSSRTEGLRACVSQVYPKQFKDLEIRLKQFHSDHSKQR